LPLEAWQADARAAANLATTSFTLAWNEADLIQRRERLAVLCTVSSEMTASIQYAT
jgi:hypothetical protein